jgi:hypothetical protein
LAFELNNAFRLMGRFPVRNDLKAGEEIEYSPWSECVRCFCGGVWFAHCRLLSWFVSTRKQGGAKKPGGHERETGNTGNWLDV